MSGITIIIIMLAVAIVAIVLWGFASFGYVVKQKNAAQNAWDEISNVLAGHNEQCRQLTLLCQRPGIYFDDPSVIDQARAFIAQDNALDPEDVKARTPVQYRLSKVADDLLESALHNSQLSSMPELKQMQTALGQFDEVLQAMIMQYNRMVQSYNGLLKQQPNNIIASRLGYGPLNFCAVDRNEVGA